MHFNFCSQSAEPLPEEDDSFELPDDYQPFLQETPLYTDNTANGQLIFPIYRPLA